MHHKVAVVVWDVGHNPLGRAHVLAGVLSRHFDVSIWGFQFPRYGQQIWAPLRRSTVPIHSYSGYSFPAQLHSMEALAERIDADAIWVCKPRFPSLGLAAMAKQFRNRPIVLDIDDDELAFFGDVDPLDPNLLGSSDIDIAVPYERMWTRAAVWAIAGADQVTVSNPVLQDRYGGPIVPHARDETVWNPELYDREATRRGLGLKDHDRMILFGGTVRAHKGVTDLLNAVNSIGDRRNKVALFATKELNELLATKRELKQWVLPLDPTPFAELAPLVEAADLACVLQDPQHPVSASQLPAKITDALAMRVPCLVGAVEPVRSLVEAGAVVARDNSVRLSEQIESMLSGDGAAVAEIGRQHFLSTMSYAAVGEQAAGLFDELIETDRIDPKPLSPKLETLLAAPRRLFGEHQSPAATGAGDGAGLGAGPGALDLVVFWKQNDSTLFGRRQDMLVNELQRSGRFRHVVHFDNPITPELLANRFRVGNRETDQHRMVARETAARVARRRDTNIVRRTFLYGGRVSRRLNVPSRGAYGAFVERELERAGVGDLPIVFLGYPVNDDLPELIDLIGPAVTVIDVVDDNHAWLDQGTAKYDAVDRNFRDLGLRADIVIANCEPAADQMRAYGGQVHLVPNGTELPTPGPPAEIAPELVGLKGPIVGYVGNLSSRLDVDLLEAMISDRPRWNFVFVGSTHLDRSVLRLERYPNAHFVGVRRYEQLPRFVDHFDVGIIPHVDDSMTQAMNPLKPFVYARAGVPIVSTPIANIDELGDLIAVANGAAAFIAAVERALARGRRTPDAEQLRTHSWENRAATVLRLIDEYLSTVATSPLN